MFIYKALVHMRLLRDPAESMALLRVANYTPDKQME